MWQFGVNGLIGHYAQPSVMEEYRAGAEHVKGVHVMVTMKRLADVTLRLANVKMLAQYLYITS